jgi:hypothetical protein
LHSGDHALQRDARVARLEVDDQQAVQGTANVPGGRLVSSQGLKFKVPVNGKVKLSPEEAEAARFRNMLLRVIWTAPVPPPRLARAVAIGKIRKELTVGGIKFRARQDRQTNTQAQGRTKTTEIANIFNLI